MSADTLLNEVITRIRRVLHPERIVLFGSRARGEARPGSDYDLLVIQESDQPRYPGAPGLTSVRQVLDKLFPRREPASLK